MGPITYTYEELLAHKAKGDVPAELIEKLRADADEILTKQTLKVTDIKLPRPSGNIHDYTSISGYRWPNPDTPNGLPWVRRDGFVNPDTRTGIHPGVLYGRVHTLALAAVYFPERAAEYAEYANRQLYDWFINPDSYIEPNAKYAQSIPGVCDGCSPGIIEFCTCMNLHNAVGILECMGLVDKDIKAGVVDWFRRFTDWLLTSEQGIAAGNGFDNHGAWYDAQIISTALFTDRIHLAKDIASKAYPRRIKILIRPDGSQPKELERATPIAYSFYSLDAMMYIANIAGRLGYTKYWESDEIRGECILKRAVDFLYPYVVDPNSCPYPDLHHGNYAPRMAKMMESVAKRYPGEGYAERAMELCSDPIRRAWMLEPAK